MQEDKETVFDAFTTVRDSLEISTIVIQNLSVNKSVSLAAASTGYLNATELADYLARKNLPFRRSHEIVGQMVLHAIDLGCELEELSLNEMQKFAPEIEMDVFDKMSLEQTLNSKDAIGGTSHRRVDEALTEASNYLSNLGTNGFQLPK
jgi:argininosuccinate lyase / amino-acid N-acetyltransferase